MQGLGFTVELRVQDLGLTLKACTGQKPQPPMEQTFSESCALAGVSGLGLPQVVCRLLVEVLGGGHQERSSILNPASKYFIEVVWLTLRVQLYNMHRKCLPRYVPGVHRSAKRFLGHS